MHPFFLLLCLSFAVRCIRCPCLVSLLPGSYSAAYMTACLACVACREGYFSCLTRILWLCRVCFFCFFCFCLCFFLATMSFAGYFHVRFLRSAFPVFFLRSSSQFDLVWFRLSCDHGWIYSGSVNVRSTTNNNNNNVLRLLGRPSKISCPCLFVSFFFLFALLRLPDNDMFISYSRRTFDFSLAIEYVCNMHEILLLHVLEHKL